LNGTAPWSAPVIPPVSQGHGNIIASGFIAPSPSSVNERLMKLDDYSIGRSHGSPFLDSYNERPLVPTEAFSVSSNAYPAFGLTISDPMERSFWTEYYAQLELTTVHVAEQYVSVSISGPTNRPPADYSSSPTSTPLATNSYPFTIPSSGGSPRPTRQPGLDSSAATFQALGYVSAVSSETMPASAVSVTGAAQSQPLLDAGAGAPAARSNALDSSAAVQFNAAALAVARTTGPLTDGSAAPAMPTLGANFQSPGNHAPIGSRSVSNAGGSSAAMLPLVRVLPLGGIVQLPDAKAALAEMPLDLRRMEQTLETVVSEVKLIGPEVARWLDGIHVTPLTVAIAAAAVASGSVYYFRRRGTRNADRPDEEASSSWLFARLQPTPD